VRLRARRQASHPRGLPLGLMSIERTPLTVAAARAALRARGPDELLVDEQTFRDLEIFEGEGGAALELRFGDLIKYWRIVEGVLRTSELLRSLRAMFRDHDLSAARGDLAPWLAELRTLVERPAFESLAAAPGHRQPSFLRTLRLDRTLRLAQRATIERILELIPQIDALVAMADATHRLGFTLPEVVDGALAVAGEGVYHPFVEGAVRNPVLLDQQRRLLFLTGPNMAGKTTYLRACGLALYLAHLGMGVPARWLRFAPAQCLFSAIALTDNVREGISFFRAEALRVRAIAQALAERHRVIALLDEPFKGTNVKDALDASRAVILRFAARTGSLFMVSSHLIELGDAMAATGQVDCRHFEAAERDARLVFDFVLREGVSTQRLGVRVLQEEGVFDLLDAD